MAYRPDDDVPPVVCLEPFGPKHDADSLLVGESDRHSAVEVVALSGEEVGRRTLQEISTSLSDMYEDICVRLINPSLHH